MKAIQSELEAARAANPNLLEYAVREIWKIRVPARPASAPRWELRRRLRIEKREKIRIGIPRVLGMFAYAPLFNCYFESLGVPSENIVYSDFTSEELFRVGSKRGSIDPCYPSKLALAHVHNLLFDKHKRKPRLHFLPDVRRPALSCSTFRPATPARRRPTRRS
jgi:predicted nucleotide-binding protein (sugar kinase/HSP70/actin superfamily)